MKRLTIFCVTLFFIVTNSFSLTIRLLDGNEIEGYLNGRKRDNLYFTSDRTVFIISDKLIRKIYENDEDVTQTVKSTELGVNIVWDHYIDTIRFSSMNDIREYFSSNNIKLTHPELVSYNDSLSIDYFTIQQELLLSAGDNLKKSANFAYGGILLTTVGSIIMYNTDDSGEIYIGAGLTFVGAIFQLISPSYIGKAGSNLKNISPSPQRKK